MNSFFSRWMACAVLLTLSTVGLAGCDSGEAPDGEVGALRVIATTGMVADAAQRVAGDRASVQGLMGAGIDPHLYKPTRSDIGLMADADVVLYNGLLLEGKMVDALIRAGRSGKPVYAVTEELDASALLEPEDFEGMADPHVWMDPQAWAKTVGVVRDALAAHDADGGATYQANAEAYMNEIAALDAYAEGVLNSVPAESRVLVTAHDAFNYFGRRYGYEVVGIQGLSTESEAGVQDLERIVSMLVDRKIGAVFVESTVSQRNIQAILEGARQRGHVVVIGGELFSDAMGEPGTYEGTYIGMIDHNVTTIARSLGGEAPEAGMNGKLGSHAQ
ncbi:MAG: zinc ABC transporter substrate-binding protein [Planctomycetota bacterium]